MDIINEEGRTVCGKCGQAIPEGGWPFCPHGAVKHREDEKSSYVQDQIPGGLVLNNYGPEPVTVYSHSEARLLAAARGLQYAERFSPTPGTNHDPAGIPNPAGYMDPVTLANGAALILRAAGAQAQQEAEDRAFAERAYRPLPDKVLSESEAKQMHEVHREMEVNRGRR